MKKRYATGYVHARNPHSPCSPLHRRLLAKGKPDAGAERNTGPRRRPHWEWELGITAGTLRDYSGSCNYRTHILPYLGFVYRSNRLYPGREGPHGMLWRGLDS